MRRLMILLLMSAVLICRADTLDKLTRTLDQIEYAFWRGLLSSAESSSRVRLRNLVSDLQLLAGQCQRERSGALSNAGNFTTYASNFAMILSMTSHSPIRTLISGLKYTNNSAFRKYIRRPKKGEEPDEGIYQEFLTSVTEKNLDTFVRKFEKNRNLSRTQYMRLLKIAENYFANISELRMLIFKMRMSDPVFKRKGVYVK